VTEELGIELPVFSVGYRCEYDDVVGDWTRLREIDDRGALLVRPDRYIAWRASTRPANPQGALLAALRQLLDRGEEASAPRARPSGAVEAPGA
jgi:2,4-dichlorophenol 6-monooxygenase